MGQASEVIHRHHQQLVSTLSDQVAAIVEGRPEADPCALVAFLKHDLLPHDLGEELYLYPALDPVMKAHAQATAALSIDHEYIQGYVDWIEETTEELETADEQEKPALHALLHRLCLQLEAVLQLHMAKEEKVYLPLFELYTPKEDQQHILSEMHETLSEEPGKERIPEPAVA
jgi:hemerythrin-like domain-containing protein